MYKDKKREYIKPKEYMTHKTPEMGKQDYEGEPLSKKYQETDKEDLLYKIANRAPRPEEELPEDEKAADTIKIMQKESVPREDIDGIDSLKCVSPAIIGNLFDRVKFLEDRIAELEEALRLRGEIHTEIVADIDTDISDKESFARTCADFDDLRSIKLHISMLRQQKRKELLQHFHDTLELNTELRALKEEYHSEKKIVSLFDGIEGV